MNQGTKVIESGLRPAGPDSLERTVRDCLDTALLAIRDTVARMFARIDEAERGAVSRLNEYVPTEPLLTRAQAAAYLNLKLRQFDLLSAPSNPQIPYVKIGGQKRFRKVSLDEWLNGIEVKRPRVRL